MATRQDVVMRCARLGVSMTEGGGRFFEARLECAAGRVFSCDGIHGLVVQQSHTAPRSEVWADVMERLSYGVQPCTDAECEICAEARETCRWFIRCGQPATGDTQHPILGAVPTCDRCHKFATGDAR